MAFQRDKWSRQSVALNTGQITVDSILIGGPAIFTYSSATDNLAAVGGANYFAPEVLNLHVNDIIMGVASDGGFIRRVTAVDVDAKTIATAALTA